MSQSIKLQSKTFKAGFNYQFIGKTGEGHLSYAGAFEVKPANFKMLADHIGRGYPWMPSLLDEGAGRYQQFANYAELLSLDIDSGMTIDEAMTHPYSKYLGLGIESNSSTPEHNKFRLVFRLPEPITPESGGWVAIKACLVFLAQEFGGLPDRKCKDASRFYFGAKGRRPFCLNEAVTLPDEFFGLVAANEERLAEERKAWAAEAAAQREVFLNSRGDGAVMPELIEEIRKALAFVPKRKKGSSTEKYNNYDESITVLMALHNSFGSEVAIALGEEWSPSSLEDKWDISYKVSTFNDHGSGGPDFLYIRQVAIRHGYRPKPQKRAA